MVTVVEKVLRIVSTSDLSNLSTIQDGEDKMDGEHSLAVKMVYVNVTVVDYINKRKEEVD